MSDNDSHMSLGGEAARDFRDFPTPKSASEVIDRAIAMLEVDVTNLHLEEIKKLKEVRMEETRQIYEIYAKQSAERVERAKEEAEKEVHEAFRERAERVRRQQSEFILNQIVQGSKMKRGRDSAGPK